jgi:hypothetical protein
MNYVLFWKCRVRESNCRILGNPQFKAIYPEKVSEFIFTDIAQVGMLLYLKN